MSEVGQRLATPIPWMVQGDYTHALLHLACIKMAKHENYTHAFGMVELFPSECPPPDSTPERASGTAFKPGNFRGWIQRIHLSAEAALRWYERSRAGHVFWLDQSHPESDGMPLSVGDLAEEPPWPQVNTTTDLPFLNGTWGCVRAHYLCQPERSEALQAVLDSDSAVAWLADQLFFNVRQYPEWLGAVSLIAPNPVYRVLDRHHRTIDGHTHTGVRIIPRAHMTLDSLRLDLTEYGPRGLTAIHTVPVLNVYTQIAHVGTPKEMSHKIVCERRGILDWSPPVDYIHVIGIQTEMSVVEHHSAAPAMGKIPATPYSTTMYEQTYNSQNGIPPPMPPAGAFLLGMERQRILRETAEQRDEKLFYEQPQEALDFVRQLIGKARDRVWIIDPYFDSEAFLHTISAVARYTVNVMILTGGEHLSKQPWDGAPTERGDELAVDVTNFPLTARIKVFVMSSETPPFHDRFLVVDQPVWFLGNSFNSLGDRASMLVRLNNPVQVTKKVEEIMQDQARVRPLDEWLVRRHQVQQNAASAQVTDVSGATKGGE